MIYDLLVWLVVSGCVCWVVVALAVCVFIHGAAKLRRAEESEKP